MTELEIHRPSNGLEQYTTGAVASLADWADELVAAGQLAAKLCQTAFVPSHFRGKPADAAAAILTGHELGLSPMASLRSIFLISGTPGMYAKAMVAVVQAAGHEVWVKAQSDESVTVCGHRKGTPDDHIAETTWDTARVVKAKLTSNAKYKDSPQQMMTARGQAEICRQIAPDALHGIPYSVEELQDFPDRPELSAAPKVTAAEILGTTEPEPQPEPEPVEDLPVRDKASTGQVGLLQALCAEDPDTGSEKSRRLFVVGRIVGRGIGSFNDLTKAEASAAIEAFEGKKRRTPTPPEPVDTWTDDGALIPEDGA